MHTFRSIINSLSAIIILILIPFLSISQTTTETYQFSKDIFAQIDKDSIASKYQTSATAFSFVSRYSDVLNIWDKQGIRIPKKSKDDSLYFVRCKKINAKAYIIERSKNTSIIIINEADHISKHRIYTKSLLQDLYENGYRYLGLEALFDTAINSRKYPILESGFYTNEPEFGNLISEALKIGFQLFGYEASNGKNGKEREIEQAENIQKFIDNNNDGKVLIHCGYAHAFENNYPAWGLAMAGRLKENTGKDPFTIDQTMFLERSIKENNHSFMRLNKTNQPIVLVDENGQVFNGFNPTKQTDIVVIHPETEFINNRPNWLADGKQKYIVPLSKIGKNIPVLILAYRSNEPENGIPADIIEISDKNSARTLFLPKGSYTIFIKDKKYNIVDKFKINI